MTEEQSARMRRLEAIRLGAQTQRASQSQAKAAVSAAQIQAASSLVAVAGPVVICMMALHVAMAFALALRK